MRLGSPVVNQFHFSFIEKFLPEMFHLRPLKQETQFRLEFCHLQSTCVIYILVWKYNNSKLRKIGYNNLKLQ